ncbi:MAG: RbsD/FucU domain-containing protein [Betaproteobacteria bacterium]
MLKGIHPLLSPELLHAMAAMGHGDEIALVDANFPAASLGPQVIELSGASSPDALDAVLTLFPLDTRVVPAVHTMAVVGDPAAVPEPVMDFAAVFTQHRLADCEIGTLERHAFYDRAKRAFAIVRTGEMRPYGNILLAKGVVNRYEGYGGTSGRPGPE